MTRLSKEQLLLMHEQLIDRYGGSHGIRDEGLLDSALALLVTLDLNHIDIKMSSRELEDVILSLAAGDMSEETFSEWIRYHIA